MQVQPPIELFNCVYSSLPVDVNRIGDFGANGEDRSIPSKTIGIARAYTFADYFGQIARKSPRRCGNGLATCGNGPAGCGSRPARAEMAWPSVEVIRPSQKRPGPTPKSPGPAQKWPGPYRNDLARRGSHPALAETARPGAKVARPNAMTKETRDTHGRPLS